MIGVKKKRHRGGSPAIWVQSSRAFRLSAETTQRLRRQLDAAVHLTVSARRAYLERHQRLSKKFVQFLPIKNLLIYSSKDFKGLFYANYSKIGGCGGGAAVVVMVVFLSSKTA